MVGWRLMLDPVAVITSLLSVCSWRKGQHTAPAWDEPGLLCPLPPEHQRAPSSTKNVWEGSADIKWCSGRDSSTGDLYSSSWTLGKERLSCREWGSPGAALVTSDMASTTWGWFPARKDEHADTETQDTSLLKPSLGNAAFPSVTGNECGASAVPDCSTSFPFPSWCRVWCWWMTWRRCWTLRDTTRRRTPTSGGRQSWQGTPSTPRSTWCSITWQQSWCTKVSE